MQASLTYAEISDYIKAHYNVRPKFTYVDESTLRGEWKLAIFAPTVSATLHLESCTAEQVVTTVTVDGALGTITSFFGKNLGVLDMIKGECTVEQAPKTDGRIHFCLIGPLKKSAKAQPQQPAANSGGIRISVS